MSNRNRLPVSTESDAPSLQHSFSHEIGNSDDANHFVIPRDEAAQLWVDTAKTVVAHRIAELSELRRKGVMQQELFQHYAQYVQLIDDLQDLITEGNDTYITLLSDFTRDAFEHSSSDTDLGLAHVHQLDSLIAMIEQAQQVTANQPTKHIEVSKSQPQLERSE